MRVHEGPIPSPAVRPSIDFARYLCERGLIDGDAAARVRRHAADAHTQLGQVLVERCLLTMRQVSALIDMQKRQPALRFGELAVLCNFISASELEAALVAQRATRRHQLVVVRELGLVDAKVLDEAVVAYLSYLETNFVG